MHYYVFISALSYINTTIYKLKTIGLNNYALYQETQPIKMTLSWFERYKQWK